jgi:hypothetical protein
VQRSANVEAINHLSAALELLKILPDTPERAQQELVLQLSLGSALMTTKGYAAPEIQEAYSRARELCHQLGETPQLFPVLWGLYTVYVNRGELRTAHEVAEQLLPLARRGVSGPVKRKPTGSFKLVILLDLFETETVAPEGLSSRISTFLADFEDSECLSAAFFSLTVGFRIVGPDTPTLPHCMVPNKLTRPFEGFQALRREYVKLRALVPTYRPTQASAHETTRAVMGAVNAVGAQLKKVA